MPITKLTTIAVQLQKIPLIRLGIARLLQLEDDEILCRASSVDDHVGVDTASLLAIVARAKVYFLGVVAVTVVFTINVSIRKGILDVDGQPMCDGTLVDVDAEKISVGLKQLPHALDDAIRGFNVARTG